MPGRWLMKKGERREITNADGKILWDVKHGVTDPEGDCLFVGIYYPRRAVPTYVEVDLVDTRAADGIRISYDLERDGYVIEQASRFEWEADEEVDSDWQEVAFVEAWAREATEGGC